MLSLSILLQHMHIALLVGSRSVLMNRSCGVPTHITNEKISIAHKHLKQDRFQLLNFADCRHTMSSLSRRSTRIHADVQFTHPRGTITYLAPNGSILLSMNG